MNASLMLLIVAGVATAAILLGALRNPHPNSRGWIYMSGVILILSAIALVLAPDMAGYIAIGLFALLAIVPTQSFRAINRRVYRGDYAGARRIGRWLRWLHPFRDWAWHDASLLAYQHAEQGDLDGALTLLNAQQPQDDSRALQSEMYARRLYGDWPALHRWLVAQLKNEELRRSPDVLAYHIRALGEIGDLNGMLQAFDEHKATIGQVEGFLEQCYVFIFAFCGRPAAVQDMYDSGLMSRNETGFHELWLGTAELAAGEPESGRARLTPLLESSDPLYRTGAERRLQHGVPLAAASLDDESYRILANMQRNWPGDLGDEGSVTPEKGHET